MDVGLPSIYPTMSDLRDARLLRQLFVAHKVVIERICMSPLKPSSMQAEIASENSSTRARPFESNSLSACRMS
jgi:hypothetical protein